jgi:hypothetical protein
MLSYRLPLYYIFALHLVFHIRIGCWNRCEYRAAAPRSVVDVARRLQLRRHVVLSDVSDPIT